MTNEEKELSFILALSAGFSICEDKIIKAWNAGNIYIFDQQGIKDWYLDVIKDQSQDWKKLLNEDVTENYVIVLDDNTYALYI